MRALALLLVHGLLAVAHAQPPGDASGDDAVEVEDGWTLDAVSVRGPQTIAPPIGEVIAAAYAAAGLDRDPARGIARRARLSGLVPVVSVRTSRSASWRDDDGVLAGPDVGRGQTWDVRATWRLDRLVFEPREIQAASLATARHRERRRLARVVVRSYFFWRRTGAEEVEAELDALTDGWFSQAVVELRRTASEFRTLPPPVATP